MELSCPCPDWSVEDTETLEMKFNIEVRGKAPSKEKHREFAKHLGFLSAEKVCLRIAKIASGLYL